MRWSIKLYLHLHSEYILSYCLETENSADFLLLETDNITSPRLYCEYIDNKLH